MKKCKSCGAPESRSGTLVNEECKNCIETEKRQEAYVSSELERTQDEIFQMIENKLVKR